MTVKVIAEAGVNWDTVDDLIAPSAVQYIVSAKAAGADFIKFQLFNKEVIADSPIKDKLEKYILTEEGVKLLKEEADKHKIGLILTPMYLEAVDLAAKYADYIKIRFKDHENKQLLDKAVDTGKSLLISVPGPLMAYSERQWPLLLRAHQLYCIPRYPPEPEDFDFGKACACQGFSSHYPHTLFDLMFAMNRIYDNVFIEKHVMFSPPVASLDGTHFTKLVDGEGKPVENWHEPIDAAVSVTFEDLASFIKQLQLIERIKRVRI